ncbi:hypothetical protein [[Mycoplasma] gypis]|uniref:DUF4044 domain-containing protein n=1 Tax=[Mycoplasma] gypis TaxID=92404 RepID=A0ABZ2RMS1_9BACT|nr:hypothetical protein [[Mycoplasma] gypis]
MKKQYTKEQKRAMVKKIVVSSLVIAFFAILAAVASIFWIAK